MSSTTTPEPAAIAARHTPAAQAFAALAECIVTEAIPLVEMVTCTARKFSRPPISSPSMPEPQAHSDYLDPTN